VHLTENAQQNPLWIEPRMMRALHHQPRFGMSGRRNAQKSSAILGNERSRVISIEEVELDAVGVTRVRGVRPWNRCQRDPALRVQATEIVFERNGCGI